MILHERFKLAWEDLYIYYLIFAKPRQNYKNQKFRMIDLLEAEIQEHRDDTKKQTENPNTAHNADGSVDVQSSERKRVRELFYDQLDQEEEIKQAKITVKEAAAQQKAICQQILDMKLDGQGKLGPEARNLGKKLLEDATNQKRSCTTQKNR